MKPTSLPLTTSKSIPSTRLYLLWIAYIRRFPKPLSRNIIREICLYLPQPHKLVKLTAIAVLIFDLSRLKWANLCKLNSYFSASASVVAFNDGRIFGCGGNFFKGKELKIRIESWLVSCGNLRKLEDMREKRCFHGICTVERTGVVYVWGGEGDEQGAETYIVSTSQWRKLPNMLHPHSSFQPCVHHTDIILCGGNRHGLSEAYSLQTLSYRPLSIVTNMGFVLTVTAGEELITYSRMAEQRWSMGSDCVSTRNTEKWDLSTRCPPVYYEGCTYIASAVENCVYVVSGLQRLKLH